MGRRRSQAARGWPEPEDWRGAKGGEQGGLRRKGERSKACFVEEAKGGEGRVKLESFDWITKSMKLNHTVSSDGRVHQNDFRKNKLD